MSASVTPEGVASRIAEQLAARAVTLDPGMQRDFATFLARADRRIRTRSGRRAPRSVASSEVSTEVRRQIDILVAEIERAAVDGLLTEAAFAEIRLKLCPGFWPFC